MKYLDLSHNFITDIEENKFSSMVNLTHLNLTRNNLASLNSLQSLPILQTLIICDNDLKTLPSFLMTKWHPLIHLAIGDNPFDCTCEIKPFQDWIFSDTVTFIDIQISSLCKSPSFRENFGMVNFHLDCRIHLEIYIPVASVCLVMICMTVALVYRYRWRIRYKLFVMFYLRRHRRDIEDDNDDDILNDDEEDDVDAGAVLRRRYHAYVAYHSDNEDWVDEQLIANLEEGLDRFRLCLKERDLPANRPKYDIICHGIYHSRKTIAVLSKQFLDDGLCNFQLQVARMRLTRDNDDVLILVQLGEIPDDKMTLLLRQILCYKERMMWPDDPVAQEMFWGQAQDKTTQANTSRSEI